MNYPTVFSDKGEVKLFNISDTLSIFSYNNLILYRLFPSRKLETNERIKGTETYFIYKKKDEYGYWYKSLKDSSSGIKSNVDSFLNNRAFANAKFSPGKNDSLVQTINNGKDTTTEKYFSKTKSDESYFDSSYYYYNKDFNNIAYTFSKELDSAKCMKLYKVRLLYNGGYSPTYKIIMPKREFLFEIRPLPITNPNEIKKLFERFGKNNL